MKELTRITLINSGDFEYAALDLSYHTLLAAHNNQGKTTLLRLVPFSQTGNPQGLGLKDSESFSYYFSRKGLPGFMAFDYVDKGENSERKYCLLCMAPGSAAGHEYHFIDAEFDKDWLKDSEGSLYNNWGGIKQNLERLGVSSSVTAKNDSELRKIMNGRAEDKRTYSYAMFTGGKAADRNITAAAAALESIWKNGSLDQSSIKNIFIDKVRLRPGVNIPEGFSVKELRDLTSNFSSIYNDYVAFRSGLLDEKLGQTINAYEKFLEARDRCVLAPGTIRLILLSYNDKVNELSSIMSTLTETLKVKKEELRSLRANNNRLSVARQADIKNMKEKIGGIEDAEKRYTPDGWKEQEKWVRDLFELNGISRYSELISSRKADLQALRASVRELSERFEEKLKELENNYNRYKAEQSARLSELSEKKLNDPLLDTDEISRRKAAIWRECDEVIAKKTERIETQITDLSVRRQRLESALGSLSMLEVLPMRNLVDAAAEKSGLRYTDNLLSFTEEFLILLKTQLFGYASAEACRKEKEMVDRQLAEFSGMNNEIKNSTRKEYQNKEVALNEEINSRKNFYTEESNKIKELLASYSEQYLKSRQVTERDRKAALAGKGFDFEREKTLIAEIERFGKNLSYLQDHYTEILQNKSTLEDIARLPEYRAQLSNMKKEHDDLSRRAQEEELRQEESIKKDEATFFEARKSSSAIRDDREAFDNSFQAFCFDYGFDYEKKLKELDKCDTRLSVLSEGQTLCGVLSDWIRALNDQGRELQVMMRSESDLKNILSPEDNFGFSFGPNDTFIGDDDYLRVASNIRLKVKSEESSPEAHCQAWSREWSHLLRAIITLYRDAQIKEKIEREVVELQRYINAHNQAHSIRDVRFNVTDEPDFEVLRIAKELNEFFVDRGIDPFTEDTSDIGDGDLFTQKRLSSTNTKEVVELLNAFSHALNEFRSDVIPPENFFKITISATETETGVTKGPFYNIKDFGSAGTSTTLKMLLAMCFVSNAISKGRDSSNRYAIAMDEDGTIDPTNREAILSMADALGFKIVTAQPTSVDGFNIYSVLVENGRRKIIPVVIRNI